MVGDHPVMHVARPVRLAACGLRARLDQAAHQVGVVIVVLALQQRADALQPHAGVDRLHVELAHEPSSKRSFCMKTRFQISMKRSPSSSALPGGPPQMSGPVVVEDLGAGAAGAGRAHRPEIVVEAMRMIRSSGSPAYFFQISAASSSVW